jgi:hypothetical protein
MHEFHWVDLVSAEEREEPPSPVNEKLLADDEAKSAVM